MSCNEVKYFISTEFIESHPTRRYILYISQLTTMRVQPSPPRPVRSLLLVLGRHKLGDRLQLDVGRALVDGADLGVAVELLDAVVLGEAHAAEPVCSKAVESARL